MLARKFLFIFKIKDFGPSISIKTKLKNLFNKGKSIKMTLKIVRLGCIEVKIIIF